MPASVSVNVLDMPVAVMGRPRELPAARHYCEPLKALAIYVDNPQPRLFPSDRDREAAGHALNDARVAKEVIAEDQTEDFRDSFKILFWCGVPAGLLALGG